MTLTEFLLARIAEDEAAVASALEVSGEPAASGHEWTPNYDAAHGVFESEIVTSTGRAQGECEAKRHILQLHGNDWNPRGKCATCDEVGPCDTLRSLAVPYADHPDYDEAWRP